jgi:predicted membrane protein
LFVAADWSFVVAVVAAVAVSFEPPFSSRIRTVQCKQMLLLLRAIQYEEIQESFLADLYLDL